ncbi:MAG: cell wall metabolism sensor histidine kinase WalK [Synechococcaceae cyanobacterium RL_1_2]|nr:cell wall metabolism sensor histidine kinase WalK [Synechococcaceae cyanobacterium RL_1_2]
MFSLITKLNQLLTSWWAEFNLQTKLMAGATLIVSLLMSAITFWAVNTIQQDARLNDTRFGSDLGLLIAANSAPMIAEHNLGDVAKFAGRFYSSTSSVRYIIYADEGGEIFFGIPYSASEVNNELSIQRRIQLPKEYQRDTDFPLVRQHLTPNGEVTDVFVPIRHENKYLGVLALGINPNDTVVASSNLTRDVTIAVFITIWAMVILGAVFNALTITRPIKELLVGVKNIATGNFKQRINLPLGGELGQLIDSFNEMAQRLEKYEEQNIEELTAEKAKLETLVSTIADGAILVDTDMHIILANPTARSIFNWGNQSIIGENFLDYLPLDVSQQLIKPLKSVITDDQAYALDPHPLLKGDYLASPEEFTVVLEEPKPCTIRILLTEVLDQARENIRGIAITIRDITKETELNEAKSQFISNVSHELRTPLFNIKSFIETLAEYGEELSDQEKKEFLDTANHETDRLTRLVNDVLDLSRLESAKIYQLVGIDLEQLVGQTLRTYKLNAKDKQIELNQDIELDLPLVLGHYDLLLQVLTNLVGNAFKFTNPSGMITIRAYRYQHPNHGPKVRIEVADTGIGIEPKDQESIFNRFFRVENKVHTLEGTGLGLSIVRNIIVNKHHSQVYLVSEVGVGTTFWFDLDTIEESVIPEVKHAKAIGYLA